MLKAKIKTLSATLIAAVFSLMFFLVYPLFNDIRKNSADILDQKQKLLMLESRTENMGKFQTRYAEIEPDLKKAETLFVKTALPVDFIRFLEKTAKDSNVEVKISLSAGFFQATIKGSFPNFLRFLERLQFGQYLINVQNLSVAGQEGVVSASISFQALAK